MSWGVAVAALEPKPLASEAGRLQEASRTSSADMGDFDEVYSKNFDFVWRSVRALGIPASAADDVAQDVFMIVHRKLPSFELSGSLRAWLFGIVRRVCKDHRRAQQRRGVHVEFEGRHEVAGANDPQAQLSQRQSLRLVEAFAASLNDSRRELFFLSLVEELPIAEVALTLGINQNTAYSRVRQLREELLQHVRRGTPTIGGARG